MPPRKPKKGQATPLADVLADRVRYYREHRKWTQDELAEQMALLGFNWSRVTVAEVEGKGRGRRVTVEELLALAMTFGVGVIHLLAKDGSTRIADKLSLTPAQMRAAMTVGHGDSGLPELQRLQLEFQRDQARAYLDRAEDDRQQAEASYTVAVKSLEDIENKLASLADEEESK